MFALSISVLAVIVAYSSCQVHIGPVPGNVECYHCTHSDTFPSCLDTPVTCDYDEMCRIRYGDQGPRIDCRERQDCIEETTEDVLHPCAGGGVEIQPGRCEKCCDTDQCIKDLTDLLKTEFPENLNLTCPGTCPDDDIQQCLDTASICYEGDFCQVQKDNGMVMGVCRDLNDYQNCLDHLVDDPCDAPVGQNNQDRCYWDCCSNNQCLEAHFMIAQGNGTVV